MDRKMFASTLAISWIIIAFAFILSATLLRRQRQHDRKQAPSPRALPVLGHLTMLGNLPHRTFQSWAKKYGPIMSLRLGQAPTLVLTSPEAVELFLKTHETVFKSRSKREAYKYLSYGYKGMIFAEYGAYWRQMRKVCTLQLLSASKVESFASLRKREVEAMVKSVKKASTMGEVVNLSEVVMGLLEEIVYKMVLGRSKDNKFDLKGLVKEALDMTGKFNIADFVPWLGVLDIQHSSLCGHPSIHSKKGKNTKNKRHRLSIHKLTCLETWLSLSTDSNTDILPPYLSFIFLEAQSHNNHPTIRKMFPSTSAISWIIIAFIFILSATLLRRQRQHDRKQAPSPPALPVLGHLTMLGNLPHRTFQSWAKKYGPIMSVRLGQAPTLVLTSPEAAELFLKTHETAFKSRSKREVYKYLSYGYKGMIFAEYGAYWRQMRKVCTLQLLSASKVESFAPLRKREVEAMVKSVKKASTMGEVVNLSEVVMGLLEEIVYKMVFGRSKDNKFNLKGLIKEALDMTGKFNIADFVPWLGVLDIQVSI
ncbi:hypothetical protein VNO77_33053 [Canavalia gladiata]|uniref:Uncharacterized protein n=1 Tax=Canavalia gladiata TaxID=3824 RepID=A0AAN9KE84_CANGL